MDPVMRAWMFHQWLEDFGDEHKMLENQGYLIGSFINPEAVSRMLGKNAQVHTSSDTEFDETTKKIFEANRKEEKHRRKRKRIAKG